MPDKVQPLPLSNSTFEQADIVVVGVPDNSGNTYRAGAETAPDAIRNMANANEVGGTERHGKKSIFSPGMNKLSAKVHDYGNISRTLLAPAIKKIAGGGKLPIVLGGDHSITYKAVATIAPKERFSVIYFDAHPDFICSKKNYFGSVMCDLSKLKNMDPKSSIIVGIRSNEDEEIDNIRKTGVRVITATEVQELGIKEVARIIGNTVGDSVYMSTDIDVVDPAFAPGVSVPVPGGLTSNELLYLVRSIAKRVTLGFDIMEVSPPFDHNGITAYLAYRLLLEFLSAKA